VCENGQADEERFGYTCLVNLAGQKQVRFGRRHRARGERYQGRVGQMYGGEYAECVGRVSLYARDCSAQEPSVTGSIA